MESIPSFSYHNLGGRQEEDESDWEDDEDGEGYLGENDKKMLQENIRGRDRIMAIEGGGLRMNNDMGGQEMHLVKGLNVDGRGGSQGGGGGGSNFNSAGSTGDGGQEVEEYYKQMIKENPGNPFFLSNYAHFLYRVSHVPPVRLHANFQYVSSFHE